MAESTFSRRIEVKDESSMNHLKQFLESEEPARKLAKPVYSQEEREKCTQLLRQCLKKTSKENQRRKM